MTSNPFSDYETDRGQVGIGTLIVFIALVLVAAIAAGVLINTAGFLQTQAERTGEESTDQVANNLNAITAVGEIGGDNDADDDDVIGQVRVVVQPAAGADDINLAELTIQFISDGQFATLTVGGDADGDEDPENVDPLNEGTNEDSPQYGVDVLTAENEDDIVMTDSIDRYELVIDTDIEGDDALGALEEGTEVELTITTGDGSQTTELLQVPDSLAGEDQGDTVGL